MARVEIWRGLSVFCSFFRFHDIVSHWDKFGRSVCHSWSPILYKNGLSEVSSVVFHVFVILWKNRFKELCGGERNDFTKNLGPRNWLDEFLFLGSQPLAQRAIQPRQELDYLVRRKVGTMPSVVEAPKKPSFPESPQTPKTPESPRMQQRPFVTFNPPAVNATAPRPIPDLKPLSGAPTNFIGFPANVNKPLLPNPPIPTPNLPTPNLPTPSLPTPNLPTPMAYPWQPPPSRLRVAERMVSQRSANLRLLQIQQSSPVATNGPVPSAVRIKIKIFKILCSPDRIFIILITLRCY